MTTVADMNSLGWGWMVRLGSGGGDCLLGKKGS